MELPGDSRILSLIGEFARHAQPLRQYIESKIPLRLRRTLSADDVLQETWLVAFQRYDHFVPIGNESLQKWLFGIGNRVLWNAIKAAGTRKRGGDRHQVQARQSRSKVHDLIAEASGQLPTPSKEAAAIEAAAAVRVAVDHLPDQYRKVIEMRYLQGYSQEEIARRLNKSQSAVNSLLYRGMCRMRSLMGEAAQFFSDVHDFTKGSSSQTGL